jgi:hypothetical protein
MLRLFLFICLTPCGCREAESGPPAGTHVALSLADVPHRPQPANFIPLRECPRVQRHTLRIPVVGFLDDAAGSSPLSNGTTVMSWLPFPRCGPSDKAALLLLQRSLIQTDRRCLSRESSQITNQRDARHLSINHGSVLAIMRFQAGSRISYINAQLPNFVGAKHESATDSSSAFRRTRERGICAQPSLG